MANPQLEDGYFKIANELYEAWMRTRIPGETEQVLKAIIRKTYGFNKKEDRMSVSQIAAMTKMSNSHVCRALKMLITMCMITKKGNVQHPTYAIQKDYDKWKPLPKKVIRPNSARPIGGTQNTLLKKTIIKDYPAAPDSDKTIPDGTYKYKVDLFKGELSKHFKHQIIYSGIGELLKMADQIGEVVIAIRKAATFADPAKNPFGAIKKMLQDRGSWSHKDYDDVKAETNKFDLWMEQEFGKKVF